MLIGYARTSTVDQNYSLEDQLEKLAEAGCEPDNIHSEQQNLMKGTLQIISIWMSSGEYPAFAVT